MASVRYNGGTHAIDLINLSGGGAMISCDFEPRLWERVDLVLGEGGEIECAVRWLRGDRVGLEFAHETRIDCDPDARDALLLDVIHRSFPDVKMTGAADRTAPDCPDDSDEVTNSRRVERRHPLIWIGRPSLQPQQGACPSAQYLRTWSADRKPGHLSLGGGGNARPGRRRRAVRHYRLELRRQGRACVH